MRAMANYLATTQFKNLLGKTAKKKKSVMMTAINKFTALKKDKEIKQKASSKKNIEDRLKVDKKFLLKLTRVETLVPSKK